MLLTRPIREVLPATPRARIVRIDLQGESFPYQPGQAVLLARHGHDRRRPYSLAAAPEDAKRDGCLELLVGVDADERAHPHLPLSAGMLVDIEGPMGRFVFPEHPEERHFLFIAGGTGISPLRAMLRHALNIPHDSIGLLYSARTPADFAYEQELRLLAERGRIELELRVTREASDAAWIGARGRLVRPDLAPLVHGRDTLCFICGPGALVAEIRDALHELGVPRRRIRTEEWA